MIMKMHSYLSTNGELAFVHKRAEHTLNHLKIATEAEGGWDAALQVAETAMLQHESPVDTGTPEAPADAPAGSTTSYIDARTAVTLRQRIVTNKALAELAPNGSVDVKTTGTSVMSVDSRTRVPMTPPSPSEVLMHHPSAEIAALARTHAELERDLTGAVAGRVRWPANITLRDFTWYQLTPTLVYELEYPRTERIRPLYVFEKTAAFLGSFALLYTIVESFIIPLTPTKEQSFARSLLDLAMPFMISYLLLFYIIFGAPRVLTRIAYRANVRAHRMHLQRLRRAELVSPSVPTKSPATR